MTELEAGAQTQSETDRISIIIQLLEQLRDNPKYNETNWKTIENATSELAALRRVFVDRLINRAKQERLED